MTHKLDNPKRIEELNPKKTLMRIGLSEHGDFCDIGAGTGIFTFAAAQTTKGNIYAAEISASMREILHERNNAPNVLIEDSVSKVPDSSCDIALLCTVLHELDDAAGMLKEIQRILKNDGLLAVIEFHKSVTPIGPPVEHRISEKDAADILTENGFEEVKRFELGENFYCLVFRK
ncbi:class I SAM-dependent methyltransferase [Konateibacter massiliensis]|uniref:class I SAM-dependent methyltransferase n=1 Tax=Konateibacter massiliensis TaxID=2002841 RepID=UPI000C14CFA5|nr:class I SAM-dependent methyltransferase [Konateibacter massiliensis]